METLLSNYWLENILSGVCHLIIKMMTEMLNKKNKFTRKIFVEDLDMRNVRVDGSQTSGAQLKEEGS